MCTGSIAADFLWPERRTPRGRSLEVKPPRSCERLHRLARGRCRKQNRAWRPLAREEFPILLRSGTASSARDRTTGNRAPILALLLEWIAPAGSNEPDSGGSLAGSPRSRSPTDRAAQHRL